MTVTTSVNKIIGTGDAVQVDFPYDFIVLEESHMNVYLDGVLEDSANWSIAGLGVQGGGVVTMTSAPGNGVSVTLLRVVPNTQLVDYSAYGSFPAETHERALDLRVMEAQQAQEEVTRGLRFPVDVDPAFNSSFPAPEAGKAWKITADGLGVEHTTLDLDVVVVEAEAAADAAAASEAAAAASEAAAAASEIAAAASEAAASDSEIAAAASEVAAAASAAETAAPHATRHTDGTDDIQSATNAQKGLATAAHITAIEANTARTTTSSDYPEISTSLMLNIAGAEELDKRVTVTRASEKSYIGFDGIMRLMPSGQPAIDYDPITGECKGVSVHAARTNLLLNSLLDGTNLSTQSITTTATARTLSFYGDGQIVLTGTHSATVVGTGVYPARTEYTYTPTAGTLTLTVTGTVQFANDELGGVATPFIPTAGAQVTRAADILTMTGTDFSNWYRQDEGTFVVGFSRSFTEGTSYDRMLETSDNTASNKMSILFNPTISPDKSFVTAVAGGVVQVSTAPSVFSGESIISAGYKVDDWAVVADGGTPETDTSALVPAVTRLNIGSSFNSVNYLNGHISYIAYYPKRLTDAELQTISEQ